MGIPPSDTSATTKHWIQWLAWAATGGLWLLWLGYEDRGPATPVAMAASLAAAWALSAILHARRTGLDRGSGVWRPAVRIVLIGLAAGAAVGPLAALLMLLKASIHSHPELDFTPADLSAAIRRTPIWTAVGLLAGAGAALLAAARGRGPSSAARDAHCVPGSGDSDERGAVQSRSPTEDADE